MIKKIKSIEANKMRQFQEEILCQNQELRPARKTSSAVN